MSLPGGELEDPVRQVVLALKDGIGATAVGVFDDDRGEMYETSEASPKAFWNILRGIACSRNWGAWYRDLRSAKHLEAGCSCLAQHTLHAFLLFERWVILVLVEGRPAPYADAVMASAMRQFGKLLSSKRVKAVSPKGGSRGGGGGEEPRLGIPLWWVKKS